MYIIITPCFNEQSYIDYPLKSISSQTIEPIKWIIVDDSSTDSTAEIIKKYATNNNFIDYHYRVKPNGQDYFTSNVFAIMEGWDQIKHLEFEYLAILDSDITLPVDYYEKIIAEFEKDSMLGIASGIYENLIDGKLHPVLNDRRSTPKAIQVFRKEAFEQIGGYLPLKYGGEDTAACVMARMHGWKVWSFPEIKVVHHRPTGTGNAGSLLKAKYNQGLNEYFLGSHCLFVFIKCIKRSLKEKPYFIGGVTRFLGYIMGRFNGEKRIISKEFMQFFRKEQIKRLLSLNKKI